MELLRNDTTDVDLASRGESGTHVIPRGRRGGHDDTLQAPLFDALARATMSERERHSAQRLLAADLDVADDNTTLRAASDPPVSSNGTRLAHAVARTTLDSWRRGEVDGERVAEAYAELASRVLHVA
jgi:hypothetical protein